MCHTWNYGSHLENGSRFKKWVTLGKMCYPRENESHMEKWVTLWKMGRLKNCWLSIWCQIEMCLKNWLKIFCFLFSALSTWKLPMAKVTYLANTVARGLENTWWSHFTQTTLNNEEDFWSLSRQFHSVNLLFYHS